MLNKQENIAQAQANLAQANRRADWTVEVGFQQRGAAYSNMVSIGVSVPLQWDRKNRQDRDVAAKAAMAVAGPTLSHTRHLPSMNEALALTPSSIMTAQVSGWSSDGVEKT